MSGESVSTRTLGLLGDLTLAPAIEVLVTLSTDDIQEFFLTDFKGNLCSWRHNIGTVELPEYINMTKAGPAILMEIVAGSVAVSFDPSSDVVLDATSMTFNATDAAILVPLVPVILYRMRFKRLTVNTAYVRMLLSVTDEYWAIISADPA